MTLISLSEKVVEAAALPESDACYARVWNAVFEKK